MSKPAGASWFEGGELNASCNSLDRHVERGSQNAIIFEGDYGAVTNVT